MFSYFSDPGSLLAEPLALVGVVFWLWMLIHCMRHDPDRNQWLWLLIVLNVLGAVVYFVVRWLPDRRVSRGGVLKQWTRGREISKLEAAARRIGNPHHFVLLGDAYREVGKKEKAAEAYARALSKEPANLSALWGLAQVKVQSGDFAAARPVLETILKADATYKFGDTSLAYGRVLCELKDTEAARQHLEAHLKRWPHPEAYVLLATLLVDIGEPAAARSHLENTLSDLDGSPDFFVRQNKGWARKAKRLLKTLPE